MTHLGIVGAGASGAAALIANLGRRDVDRITLFDPNPVGHGIAFASEASWHLCNTSVGVMSLRADDPADFEGWLSRDGSPPADEVFVPRRQFRRYVADRLLGAIACGTAEGRSVDHVQARVTAIRTEGGRALVALDDGASCRVDEVVLCAGVGAPRVPPAWARLSGEASFFQSPYDERFDEFLRHDPGARVLVLGTNLTAVDAAKTILQRGGSVVMVSPTAVLPSVRTSLRRVPTHPIGLDEFTRLSADPSSFWDGYSSHLDQAGRDRGMPLRTQVSDAVGAVSRLADETALAFEGRIPWQESVGEYIDLANRVWSRLPGNHMRALSSVSAEWMKRHVSAIPIENAWALLSAHDDSRLDVRELPDQVERKAGGWRVRWTVGQPRHFSAVVCAAGSERHPWRMTGDGVARLDRSAGGAIGIDADLNVQFPCRSTAFPFRVIGDQTGSRFPVVNYMRTSVLQAHSAAGRSPHRDGITCDPPAG
ncbi:FAD/NAD(P)-binding protein [Curtobacterium sp. VKM Ac-2884]|uniref:FAD/NAD(P)-binding protein n=1 Tax=Curtobacterium sp. VKM Ac-2884 TaxID=2783818 RepID=UPI00188D610C|nr:FAD/NAD(P)-binding protein [Curtobacterium sp. VKM Ac-2884]MBF4603456.1 FAD/NAD(P)-binding protein [Curtobacterium sp. VKM Ac-2884]